jgi:hypothetical protein
VIALLLGALIAALTPDDAPSAGSRGSPATAAAAGPAPAAPCTERMSVALDRGYQVLAPHGTPGAPCAFQLVSQNFSYKKPLPSPAPVGQANVAFDKDGMTIEFKLRQPAPLIQAVRLDGQIMAPDDHVTVFLRRPNEGGHVAFRAEANSLGKCVTFGDSPKSLLKNKECSVSIKRAQAPDDQAHGVWAGTLTIPYSALDANGLTSALELRIQWTVKNKGKNQGDSVYYGSGGPREPYAWTVVDVTTSSYWPSQQYAAAGANVGYNPDVPPHRVSGVVNLPVSAHDFLSATVSDDSSRLLSTRDKALKDILPKDKFAKFKCVSCGSFVVDHTSAFDPIVTSASMLGADFGKLGVDAVPFAFDSIGYPIDFGYKALAADETIGFAAMHGTTAKDGIASDQILRVSRRFTVAGTGRLDVDVFDALADRSILTTPAPAPYAPLVAPRQHTRNVETSLGYSSSRLSGFDAGNPAVGSSETGAVTTHYSRTVGALLRYGSQYAPGSQRLDAAASIRWDPPAAQQDRLTSTLRRYAVAAGYRNVGPGYAPLDATFDPVLGLHGWFGRASYSAESNHVGPTALSVTTHRFSDAAQARDEGVTVSGDVRVDPKNHLNFTQSVTVGTLAVSQAAHLLKTAFVVSDQAGGRNQLPNNSYSLDLTYRNGSFQIGAGFTNGNGQNCNDKVGPPPCYSYRQPSITGTFYWEPPRTTLFLTAAVKNQNDDSLDLVPGLSSRSRNGGSTQETTAGHIIHNAAIGTYLFRGRCSTATFTTENRGGDSASFAKSAPVPGFTNTASIELMPVTDSLPAIVFAWLRTGSPGKPVTSQALVRVRVGAPDAAFKADLLRNCANRK